MSESESAGRECLKHFVIYYPHRALFPFTREAWRVPDFLTHILGAHCRAVCNCNSLKANRAAFRLGARLTMRKKGRARQWERERLLVSGSSSHNVYIQGNNTFSTAVIYAILWFSLQSHIHTHTECRFLWASTQVRFPWQNCCCLSQHSYGLIFPGNTTQYMFQFRFPTLRLRES